MTYAFMADDPPPPRRRGRINWPLVVVVLALAGIGAAVMLRPATISERQREDKTVRVVLPPPPTPPPPPQIQPVERPPEPTPTPMDQPIDEAPPPPDASSEPTAGDNVLTAREGAGPSNYGLARGDGSGSRIGGRPGGGGDAFAAYANIALAGVRQAAQSDRDLSRARFTARLAVTVDPEGRIVNVRLVQGSGDARRDARLIQVLTGVQLAQRPPAGLPVMRIELNARAAG